MLVPVKVTLADDGGQLPEPGEQVRIELRDTSIADAASTVVTATDTTLRQEGDRLVATADLEVDEAAFSTQADLSLWARCGPGAGARGLHRGDWVTMEAWPVRAGDLGSREPVQVRLRPVR